jgi:hypothetical protein
LEYLIKLNRFRCLYVVAARVRRRIMPATTETEAVGTLRFAHPTNSAAVLSDGHFAHAGHAQIARRVILSHHFGIAEMTKSAASSTPSRLEQRDVTANRHET